jgi:hypothetical protein
MIEQASELVKRKSVCMCNVRRAVRADSRTGTGHRAPFVESGTYAGTKIAYSKSLDAAMV